MKAILWAVFFIVPFFVEAQIYTVKTVPNEKLVDNSYVSSPDNILSNGAVAEINQKLAALEDSTTAQIAVVMLKPIGNADIFSFAEELFNDWGVGQAEADNGLLILYVEGQRTVRFHTGDGMEAVLPDAVCKRIQRQLMVAVRAGDHPAEAGAVEARAEAVQAVVGKMRDKTCYIR